MYNTKELPGKDYLSIELEEEGVVYHYTTVKLSADEHLSYSISVDENPNNIDVSENNEKLNRKLGYILLDLIEQGTIDERKQK